MLKGGQRLGAGRPAAADSRRHLIQFRVTEDELRDVKETAAHLGLTVTDLVRKALGLAVVLLVLALGACATPEPGPLDGEYVVEWIFGESDCTELTIDGDVASWCGKEFLAAWDPESDCAMFGDGELSSGGWWICPDSDEPGAIAGELFAGDGGPPIAAFTAALAAEGM